MAVRDVLKDDDPILRTVSREIERGDPAVRELVRDLLDTLRSESGIGIAAVQIGVPVRLVIVAHPSWPRPEVLVNPVIIDHSDVIIGVGERCLSVSERSGYVERWDSVTVSYLEPMLHWANAQTIFTGMASIIVQHELDHLDGVLFIDKITERPSV